MAQCEHLLPIFIHSVRYVDLVVVQHNRTVNILALCGLPLDDAFFVFHKTKRSVRTASLAQVRQPIFRDSVELWKRYKAQLEPLEKII